MSSERDDKQEHTEEEARHDVKNYLDTVIQTSHDGILVVDNEGRFEFGNEASFRIFGWPREELLGHHFIKVVPPDLHEFILKRWEEIQAGKGAPYEVDIVQKDGSRRSLLVSHRHMTIAGHRKYCVITKDVTENKQAQEILREKAMRESLVLRSLPMAFYIAQPFGDYDAMWISDQVNQICGFTAEQFGADIGLWASRLHPADRERALAAFDSLPEKDADDGVGFDTTSQLDQGLGLRSMTERARAVGGTIAITSKPGRTSVEVTLPVRPPETPKA